LRRKLSRNEGADNTSIGPSQPSIDTLVHCDYPTWA